jgi:hypothetical protein
LRELNVTIDDQARPARTSARSRPPLFEDMRLFHRERNSINRDEIAARQLHALAGALFPWV